MNVFIISGKKVETAKIFSEEKKIDKDKPPKMSFYPHKNERNRRVSSGLSFLRTTKSISYKRGTVIIKFDIFE